VKVVLDTNVFISGVFFSGPPYQILKAWRDDILQLVVSHDIFEEYQWVGEILAEKFPGVLLVPTLELLTVEAEFTFDPNLPEPVCEDPDDDKFLACALATRTKIIVSGDRHLLKVSGYHGIDVIRPRRFLDDYLGKRPGS
jgi:putative PIN family toxin of toxin-antitoxin system